MAEAGMASNEGLFKQLDEYPWDTDAEFQSGLSAILGPNPAPDQAANLSLRARCFYYSRQDSSDSMTVHKLMYDVESTMSL